MTDFLTRLSRRLTGPSDAPSPKGKRLLVLAAAFGVPAFAAPTDWNEAPRSNVIRIELAQVPERMPFESAGASFPGSAFYYLEDAPEMAVSLPTIDPTEQPVAPSELGKKLESGPAARAFLSAGGGMDKARAQRCMAQAIYYEAASESEAGQRAVAQVVLNRVANAAWPNSVCGVVFQGSTRSTGCQFSFTCDGSMARQPGRSAWDRAQRIAARALSGEVYAPVGLATHYHTNWVNPYWAKSLDHIGTIGAHRFYRSRGANGRPEAFRAHYTGVESTHAANMTARTALPAGSASAWAPMPAASGMNAITAPAPVPTAPAPSGGQATASSFDQTMVNSAFSGAGQVREEYANAGKWLDQPGKPVASPTKADD